MMNNCSLEQYFQELILFILTIGNGMLVYDISGMAGWSLSTVTQV